VQFLLAMCYFRWQSIDHPIKTNSATCQETSNLWNEDKQVFMKRTRFPFNPLHLIAGGVPRRPRKEFLPGDVV